MSLLLPLLRSLTRPGWALLPDLHLPRLQRRIEAVLVMPGAVLVFGTVRSVVEAAALDLADFHAGCRHAPVLPIHLVQGERVVAQRPLPFPGAAPPIACTRLLLPGLLDHVARLPPVPGLVPERWAQAPYRPVPGLMEAACHLYARHDVARLLLAGAAHHDLVRTRAAVDAVLTHAEATGTRHILFVTGAPGAGKTLCGLDTAFTRGTPGPKGTGARAAFLTGNPALLHVLRAALVRDAAARGLVARAARQRIEAVIQPLHAFRDQHVPSPAPPPDRVLVIDEAQRCWTADYAIRKSRNRPVPLADSEPALILDIMARTPGWSAIVCLLGGGQEIHAGEGGLANWGQALETRPAWHTHAPPAALQSSDPRQHLVPTPRLQLDPDLHLGSPLRAYRAPQLVRWVDAVLAGTPQAARRLAGPALPVRLTRSLAAMRDALTRRHPRRCGLLASTGARRLRAEGLGEQLWHQDEDAVARWFLGTWPDIRSAEALETAGTEFGVQGLELEHVGLCWDLDLVRATHAGTESWQARAFRATAWTVPRSAETLSNRLNAYRVLLTRARQSLIIWVPEGDSRDPTRDPAQYDAVAAYLGHCGVPPLEPGLDDSAASADHPAMPEPVLL